MLMVTSSFHHYQEKIKNLSWKIRLDKLKIRIMKKNKRNMMNKLNK